MSLRIKPFCYLILCSYFFGVDSFANQISIELQDTNLQDAIRLVAQFVHVNVMLSPSIQGTVTLHLEEANAMQAFDLLLTANGLAKWKMGNVLFIAPREELIKRKQEEVKWQEISDAVAPLTMQIWPIRYGSATEVAHLLQDNQSSLLSKRGQVRVDARTNMLYVQDIPDHLVMIRALIKRVDIPVKQILIEARLASVDQDLEQDLGVNFSHATSLPVNGSAGRYSVAIAKLADGSMLDIKLAALEDAGRAELISNPKLFTANQQPALLEAGEEIPYQEESESGGTTVVFKKAVLSLQVTPQVLPGNQVLLQLRITQDRPSNKMVQGVPAISTRQMTTSVLIHHGQTVVLGGIYEVNHERAEERIPFMSQLPIIGALFKETKTRDNKRELLIFVTPHVMQYDEKK